MKVSGPVLAICLAGGGALVVTALAVADPASSRPWTVAAQPARAAASAGSVSRLAIVDAPVVDAPPVDAPVVDEGWVADVAAATGIPSVALAAYADATLALEHEQPSCHLGWTTIAAIGNVESGHGTHGGAVLGADGRPSIPVIGPALDGDGVAAIRATPESTAWHGDPVWDHAVGPMQFLPSSWERWTSDGDGDGTADPNDIDDAALATARYLCAAGTDLSAADGWRSAVLSYNHSDDYVSAVLAFADAYARASAG